MSLSAMYRQKPPTVEAHRWTAGDGEGRSLAAWCGGKFRPGVTDAHGGEVVPPAIVLPSRGIKVYATPGDWIVLNQGEFYPMKHTDFIGRYERNV